MASLFFSPNPPVLTAQPSQQNPYDPSNLLPVTASLRPQLGHRSLTRTSRLSPLQASSSPSSSTASAAALPINVDYLTREFGGHGASFTALGDGRCAIRLGLTSGSTAGVLLPAALVTSYKAQMWHGAAAEVLQTMVKQEGDDGQVAIRGGVSLGLRVAGVGREGEEEEEEQGNSSGSQWWSPTVWELRGVRGNPESGVQVELISVDPAGTTEVTYVVTLDQAVLGLELLVTNLTSSPLHLTGSIVGHLKVSTPAATYAVGLQGSSYRNYRTPPEPTMLQGSAAIVPPVFGRRGREKRMSGGGFGFFGLGSKRAEEGKDDAGGEEVGMYDEEKEEMDNNLQLSREVCRVYTYAPRRFTIIDRGRRNSVDLERRGFEELYVLSPGSERDEPYSEQAYVTVGAAAVLRPIVLRPGEVWAGGKYLHNPNM